jgi:site-specific recombinase XerD
MQLLTVRETATVLDIAPVTLNALVQNGALAYGYYLGETNGRGEPVLGFLEKDVLALAANKGNYIMTDRDSYIAALKAKLEAECPEGLAVLKALDRQFAPPVHKHYNLVKVPNARLGFVYYVRYYDPEKKEMVGTKWCTHTNNREAAEAFASVNRERLIAQYREKQQRRINIIGILEDYYKEGSEYLKVAGMRGNTMSEHSRRTSYNFIVKTFIPYLREQKIRSYSEIEPAHISRLQDKLLVGGAKPQTVNASIRAVRAVFDYMVRNGIITENVFDRVKNLKVTVKDKKTHGCYEIEMLKGVFNREWEDRLSYILNLMIYTTNMRNSEIERVRLEDIVVIDDCYFIKVRQSKTESGERMVPLHPVVYQELKQYAEEAGRGRGDRILLVGGAKNQSSVYRKAYIDMADMLGVDRVRLEEENITYYSGRHHWKTLMSAEDLGDVDECFMGHRVSDTVKKRYDHKDKRGKERLLKKTRAVYDILNRCLFGNSSGKPLFNNPKR